MIKLLEKAKSILGAEDYAKYAPQLIQLNDEYTQDMQTYKPSKEYEKLEKLAENLTKDKEAAEKLASERGDSLTKLERESLISTAISNSKTIDTEYFRYLLEKQGLEKMEMKDGKIEGLEAAVKTITSDEKYKHIFEQVTTIGNDPTKGKGDPAAPTNVTKEQFLKMSYKERSDLYNTNKDLFNQLTNQI